MDDGTNIAVELDGVSVEARQGETVLSVSRRNDVHIPTLCHVDGISPYGVCRLCTVRVHSGSRSRFVTACNYPVREGLRIETSGPEVLAVRRLVVEALLCRCPSVEILSELAGQLGVTGRRFPAEDPNERCILCGLCVRVCSEVVGANAITFVNRGQEREVGSPFLEHPEACIGCGACAHVCPTDCISMEQPALTLLRERWGERRPCRYDRMGLLPGALCANEYECWRCETDQTLMDLCRPVHPVFVARAVDTPAVRTVARRISRMLVRTNGTDGETGLHTAANGTRRPNPPDEA